MSGDALQSRRGDTPSWDDTKPDRPSQRYGARGKGQGRKKDIGPGRPFTEDDKWAGEVRRACALAIVKWMKGSLDLSRKIKSLKIEEFDGMAEAATAEWIVQASRRIQDAPAESADLTSLLMG